MYCDVHFSKCCREVSIFDYDCEKRLWIFTAIKLFYMKNMDGNKIFETYAISILKMYFWKLVDFMISKEILYVSKYEYPSITVSVIRTIFKGGEYKLWWYRANINMVWNPEESYYYFPSIHSNDIVIFKTDSSDCNGIEKFKKRCVFFFFNK